MTKKAMAGFAALGLLIGVSRTVQAQLVTNGSFESTTNGNGQLGYNTDATGWTAVSGGYTFLFAPGTADTTGANGQYGNLTLWGPGNGSSNGLTTSPDGGNFIASDGAFQVQPIQQTINGLTVGQAYSISFYWAAAQQNGFFGATTDQWVVSFGSDTQSTPVASIPSQGFSGWQAQNFNSVATSTSEVLSFLANGTPSGVPPFALLDGVSVTAVPEPTALAAMFTGLLGLGAFVRRRSRTAQAVK